MDLYSGAKWITFNPAPKAMRSRSMRGRCLRAPKLKAAVARRSISRRTPWEVSCSKVLASQLSVQASLLSSRTAASKAVCNARNSVAATEWLDWM